MYLSNFNVNHKQEAITIYNKTTYIGKEIQEHDHKIIL